MSSAVRAEAVFGSARRVIRRIAPATLGLRAAGVFLAALAFHAWYAFHGISMYDGGILVDGAVRVLEGGVFARDFYAPYGPARYYLLAAFFRLFGTDLVSYGWLVVSVQAVADTALFVLASRWTAFPGALCAAVLLAVAHGALHQSFLVLAIVLSLSGAALAWRGSSAAAALGAGVLAGSAFLFRYDVGVFAAIALTVGAIAREQRSFRGLPGRLVLSGVGWALPVAAVVLPLLAAGASPIGWWQHESHRIVAMEGIEVPFPWPWARGRLASAGNLLTFVGISVATLAHVTWLGGVAWRRLRGAPREGDGFRAAAAVLGLLVLNQVRLVGTINRLFQVAAPAYLALADLLARRGRPAWSRALLAVLTLSVIGWVDRWTVGLYPGSYTARIGSAVRVDLERARVWEDPHHAQTLRLLVEAIQREVPEGESIATGPQCPLVAFLSARRLALPYAEPAYYFDNPAVQREIIEGLEKERPRLLVHDPKPVLNYTLGKDAPLLAQYFDRNYRLAAHYGRYQVFRRETPP